MTGAAGAAGAPAVRALGRGDAEACDGVIRSLPYHFGLASGRQECAAAVRRDRGLVVAEDGEVVGFLTLVRPSADAAEITWMAVRRDRRGRGLGRLLVERAAALARAEGCRLLVVLTVSATGDDEPDQPDGGYAATRAFYASCGFLIARDLDGLWGDGGDVPVLLVRPLGGG